MTSEEIRRQMMSSAGIDDPEPTDIASHCAEEAVPDSEEETPSCSSEEDNASEELAHATPGSRGKSMVLALVLAFFLGPLGLFYVSWKRAVIMLLLYILAVSLISNSGFAVLMFWSVFPIFSIIALGVGKR